LRIGGDKNTLDGESNKKHFEFTESRRQHAYPKNATEQDQPIAAIHERLIGGVPSRSSSSKLNAGRIPTNPAANGI
jgi:hypothetical protein